MNENREKHTREYDILQKTCETAENERQEAQIMIDGLRSEISDLKNRLLSSETSLQHEINEWRQQLSNLQHEKLELNAQLDHLNGELLVSQNHSQELESRISQVVTHLHN